MLHHIEDIYSILSESHRVLNLGGVIIIRDFNPLSIRGRIVNLQERLVGMSPSFVSVTELTQTMKDMGFQVYDIRDRGHYMIVGKK
jgi:demethylmenaquinone methyltransferase/2-methoxy-6-polyprenyl-1,4-benzoquinol methylase